MLYYVSGPVTVLEPGLAVVDCGGVGYGCRITAYTAAQLKLNQPARLYITESIREDAFDLYGFISREEQRCYELLTSVNGVGPKAAMAILSAGGPQNFTLAVMTGDEKMLTAAQGIGKKIAQRIILELKDKLGGGNVELDYSTIKYRDCSVGTFLYAHLKKTGIQKLVTEGKGESHNQYLTKMGFAEENGKFSKTL